MKKKFYVFLCMLLGVVLLLIIQRALIAIYIIVGDSYPIYDFLTNTQLQMVNIGTIVLAVLGGLLYGNYLGHHWYPLVYGHKVHSGSKGEKTASHSDEHQKTVTVKPVRVARAKVSLKSEIKDHGWDFDDLINHDMPAVESLSSSGPGVSSAVSLGEAVPKKVVRKVKRVIKRKPKPETEEEPKKRIVKKVATRKPATKTVKKITAKTAK